MLLELVGALMELPNHVIDLPNVALKVVFLFLDALVPDLSQESLDIRLGLAGVSEHLEVSPAVLASEDIRLHFHDRSLLRPKLLLDNEAAPVRLNHQRCVVLHSALLALEVGSRDEPFNRGLDSHEAASHPPIAQPSGEAPIHALDVDGEIVACDLEHGISVPPMGRVDDEQVLNDLSESIVAHQARVVDSGVSQLVAERLLVACIKWMFTSHYLVHRDAERPHVGSGAVPLEVEDFGGPVDQSVRHGLSDENLAKELMCVPGRVKLCFTDFAQKRRVVVLDVDGAGLDGSVDDVAVVESDQALADVTEPFEGHPRARTHGVEDNGFEHVADLAFLEECDERLEVVRVRARLAPVTVE